MSRSSAAQGAAFVSTQIANAHTEPGFVEIPFVLRALDWLLAAISALLETCMRRLRLVGCPPASADMRLDFGASHKALFRVQLTEDGCSKRWYRGLRFPVDFSAAAWLAKSIGTLNVSEGGSNFGRAPPSARRDVRPACKLRPNDTKHHRRRRRAPEHS